MKPYFLLSALLSFSLIFPSCKKQDSSRSAATSSFPSGFSISISHQEKSVIDDLLRQGQLKNPFDFQSKIDSIKAATLSKRMGTLQTTVLTPLDAPTYNPGQDEDDMAVNAPDYPSYVGAEDFITRKKPVTTQFQQNLTFVIRQNAIQVTVPFIYDWGTDPNTGLNTITNIRSATPVTLMPAGAYWGTVTQGTSQAVNSGFSTNPWQQSAGIEAFANAQEIRTYLTSTGGAVEVNANANLGAFQVGTKLNANFTIQSAVNIYNQYTMNASGQIWIEGITYGYNQPPNTQFQGTCQVLDYGILRNQ